MKPFSAEYKFKSDELRAAFDDFAQAKEWACVRLENLGEKFERFAVVKVYRSNVCVWQQPEPKVIKAMIHGAINNLLTVQ